MARSAITRALGSASPWRLTEMERRSVSVAEIRVCKFKKPCRGHAAPARKIRSAYGSTSRMFRCIDE